MKIQVCMWNWCKKRYSEYILKRLENDVERFDMKNVNLSTCACCWKCEEWPVVKFDKRTETAMDPIKASNMMLHWRQKNKKKKVEVEDDYGESIDEIDN